MHSVGAHPFGTPRRDAVPLCNSIWSGCAARRDRVSCVCSGSGFTDIIVAAKVISIASICVQTPHAPQQDSDVEQRCAKEHNVDAHAADKALTDNDGVTEDMLCYVKCTMGAFGMMTAAGDIDADGMIDHMDVGNSTLKRNVVRLRANIRQPLITPEFHLQIKNMINKCVESTTKTTECGYGYQVMMCILSDANELAKD